jgi:hypothetical protein
MRILLMSKYLAFVLLLCLSSLAQSQTRVSDESNISTLRSNIARMVADAKAAGPTEGARNQRIIQNLRIRLRDALIKRTGSLEARIQNLRAPGALPEVLAHAQQLQNELGRINVELSGLNRALGQAAGLPPVQVDVPRPAKSDEELAAQKDAQEKEKAEREAERAEIEKIKGEITAEKEAAAAAAKEAAKAEDDKEKVKRAAREDKKNGILAAASAITPEELNKAAAKEVTESKLPPVTCSADGKQLTSTGTTAPTEYDRILCALAADVGDSRQRPGPPEIILAQDTRRVFWILLAKLLKTTGNDSLTAFITEAVAQRVDQQIGAGSNSSGTTSLVSKGGVPYLLGLAVENGAATQSQSDTTVTFRVNPAGLINAFAKKGLITGYRQDENDPFLKILRKTSVGFTFDTSRGNQPVVFTGDKQQLSAFSARVELVNDRNPLLLKYEREWENFNATVGIELAKQIWKTTEAIMSFEVVPGADQVFTDPALQAWLIQTNNRLAGVSNAMDPTGRTNAIAGIIEDQANLLPVKLVSPETVTALTDFGNKFVAMRNKRKDLLDKIAKGKILTFEYTNTRGVNAPDLSNFNFIAATGTGARFDLTANGSFTFFNKLPLAATTSPRPGRIRDFQFAGQITKSFNWNDSQFDFWFGGRFERLMENASTVAGTMMPNTKGDIAVGQIGLNIPIKSLGMKFPISVTFANRTELIKEKTVRGNIGFTFNWDTLFSKLKPF